MENSQTAADIGAADGSDIVQIPSAPDQLPSLRDAARVLANARAKQREPEQSQQDPPAREPATRDPQTESGDEPDAALPVTEAPGETEGTEPPAQAPIEPPRSWTKEAKERWQSLPRETQDYLSSREQERERELRRGQNDAAEARKAIDAERAKVEQARSHYETALPQVMAALQRENAAEFADIKNYADVEKLAREDWPRYVLWDAQQKRIAGTRAELAAAAERQSQDRQQKLGEFIARETELFAEKAPEAADPAKFEKLKNDAVVMLREIGFTDAELGEMYRGGKELSLHDHRLQLLIRDGIRFRAATAAAKNATKPTLPPVVRPGTSQPRGAQAAQAVQNLNERLNKTGSLKDATRLLSERRKAAR